MLKEGSKRTALILVLLILTWPIFAQPSQGEIENYNGTWKGTAIWGAQNFELTLELHQNGQSLEGQIFTQTIKKNKSATYEVKGAVVNSAVQLQGTKFINKEGIWCLPGIELNLIEENNQKQLIGRWKGNSGINACWVVGVGKIELIKEEKENLLSHDASRSQVAIAADDRLGNALSNELKKRNYYALIIAVQDYTDESIVDLDQPIADAKALREELIADYTFKPQNITFLQNPSRARIIETFDGLTNSVESTDNLLVFYAGHGIWDGQIEQGYWLPSDARKGSKAAWLSNGTIRDYIRAIDSKHTLLVTDACFGGGILKTREAFQASKAMIEMYKLPSRKAMTSGALKTVPDKSVFIEYLIKALKNNEQPLVSADQLFATFKYNVINNSPNGQVPQYGVISQADDEGGDFIFLRKQ